MKLDLARTLAGVLNKAIAEAQATGADTVDLSSLLRAADDQARDELAATIAAAERAAAAAAKPQP